MPTDGLHLIQAGRSDALALRTLSCDEFRSLLATLKREYDFVIVDSAPILLVADSLTISQSVDAVLFSILREVSRMPLVYAAYERLESLGARMLGAVVTGVEGAGYYSQYQSKYQSKYQSIGKDD
jgi:Mrp family chromosome partitioning ATPase